MKTTHSGIEGLGRTLCALVVMAVCAGSLRAQSYSLTSRRELVVGIVGVAEVGRDLEAKIQHPRLRAGDNGRFDPGIHFISGTLGGKVVIFAQAERGKAGAAATALLSLYELDCVILGGEAAGLNPDYVPGDTLIASDTLREDLWPAAQNGILTPAATDAATPGWLFPPEPLLAAARAAAEAAKPALAQSKTAPREPRCWIGTLASGNPGDPARLAVLRRDFGADAIDQDSASVALASQEAGVPCLTVGALGGSPEADALKTASQNAAGLISDIIARLQGADLLPPPADPKKTLWRLVSSLDFAPGSPYLAQYPGFAQLPTLQKDHFYRPVLKKIAKTASSVSGARQIGVTLQPGVMGSGPVRLCAEVIVQGTREQALKAAAIVAYLSQRSTVDAIADSGPQARRAIELQNLVPGSWTSMETLIAAWPVMTKESPGLTPGFARILSESADSLLIVDRAGTWNHAAWQDGAVKIQRAAVAAGLKVRAAVATPVCFEVRNSWERGASGREPLQKTFDFNQLNAIARARVQIDALMAKQLGGPKPK